MSDTAPTPTAAAPKANLKNPILAGVLAFLIPGLGHYYQGRLFKAALYFVCILGTFFTGLRIGHGQVVYFQWEDPENRTYAYLCQVWAGLPALPAIAQTKFRNKLAFDSRFLTNDLNGTFSGDLNFKTGSGRLEGSIAIPQAAINGDVNNAAKFTGTLTTDEGTTPLEGTVTRCSIESQVAPNRDRGFEGFFQGELPGKSGAPPTPIAGSLKGSIPRPLWDWYEVPLNDAHGNSELDRAHRELGSRFELGVVYTMIAGLLNVLAIFDAVHGPAYGDEETRPLDPKQPAPGKTA